MRQAVLEGWTRSVSLAFIYQQLVFYATLHIAHIRQHTDIHICILYMYICTYIHTHRNVACFCRTIIACKTGMSKVCLWANNYRTSVRVCMHATKHQPTIAFCATNNINQLSFLSVACKRIARLERAFRCWHTWHYSSMTPCRRISEGKAKLLQMAT